MHINLPRFVLYGLGFLALAACDVRVVDDRLLDVGTYYSVARPATPEDGAVLPLAGSFDAAFTRVERNLRAASFQIIRADRTEGVIIARSTDPKLLACGALRTGRPGHSAPYAANAPLAIIELPGAGGSATFVQREFTSASEITVRIGAQTDEGQGIAASISEVHNATIRMTQLSDNAVIYDQTIAFTGTERARFSRGVVCGSARKVRPFIRRN